MIYKFFSSDMRSMNHKVNINLIDELQCMDQHINDNLPASSNHTQLHMAYACQCHGTDHGVCMLTYEMKM